MKFLVLAVVLVLAVTGCAPQPKEVSVEALDANPSEYASAYIQVEGILFHDRDIIFQVEGGEAIEGRLFRLQSFLDSKKEIKVYFLGQGEVRDNLKTITGHWDRPPEGGNYRLRVP